MQTVLVILAILGAGFYLVRRFILTSRRKKQAGCEKCGLNPDSYPKGKEAKLNN